MLLPIRIENAIQSSRPMQIAVLPSCLPLGLYHAAPQLDKLRLPSSTSHKTAKHSSPFGPTPQPGRLSTFRKAH